MGREPLRATRLSDILDWLKMLEGLKQDHSCAGPGFFMPYHFVTMALMLKEQGAGSLHLDAKFESYAARMRLWEAVGLESPVTVAGNPSGSSFHEVTQLVDIDAVGGVADGLTDLVGNNMGGPCTQENRESIYIALTELLSNCHHHARSEDGLHGLVCGQTWYHGQRAQFAIADSGIGIRNSLAENPDLEDRLAKENACALAIELGVSSKLNRGHAGYGLAIAAGLAMEAPGAMLFVHSYDEAVLIQNGVVTQMDGVENGFQGTLVVFEWDMTKPLDIVGVYAKWPQTQDDDDDFF